MIEKYSKIFTFNCSAELRDEEAWRLTTFSKTITSSIGARCP